MSPTTSGGAGNGSKEGLVWARGEGRGSEALLGVGLAVRGLHMEPPWGWSQTGREVSPMRYEEGVKKCIVLV